MREVDFSGMSLARRIQFAARSILGLKEAAPSGSGTSEDAGYRRLSARSDKELTPAKWDKQMRIAHFLWLQNPMAYRILELLSDFVVGDGFTWSAKDPEVAAIVEKHWEDPDNAWDLTQFDRYMELIMFGTWAPKAFVTPANGHVKICPTDPNWIAEVIPDKDIIGKVSALRITRPTADGSGQDEVWKVVARDTDPVSPTSGRMVGSVFYFAINKLSFTHTGFSELFRLADWLDAFDQFVFSLLERINFLNAHLYDITIKGAEKPEIDARIAELEDNPPQAGGFRVHNEEETWDTVTPEMNAAEVQAVADIIKMLILGSVGIPPHWFADPEGTNRATAEQMNSPLMRKMRRKQAQWSAIVKSILDFQVDQAIIAGRLSATMPDGTPRDLTVEVQPPDVSSKDIAQFITTLEKLTNTLAGAIAEGFIKREDAAGAWAAQAAEAGFDVKTPTAQDVAGNLAAEKSKDDAEAAATAQEPYADYGKNLQKAGKAVADSKEMAEQARQFLADMVGNGGGTAADYLRTSTLLAEAGHTAGRANELVLLPSAEVFCTTLLAESRRVKALEAVTDTVTISDTLRESHATLERMMGFLKMSEASLAKRAAGLNGKAKVAAKA